MQISQLVGLKSALTNLRDLQYQNIREIFERTIEVATFQNGRIDTDGQCALHLQRRGGEYGM